MFRLVIWFGLFGFMFLLFCVLLGVAVVAADLSWIVDSYLVDSWTVVLVWFWLSWLLARFECCLFVCV